MINLGFHKVVSIKIEAPSTVHVEGQNPQEAFSLWVEMERRDGAIERQIVQVHARKGRGFRLDALRPADQAVYPIIFSDCKLWDPRHKDESVVARFADLVLVERDSEYAIREGDKVIAEYLAKGVEAIGDLGAASSKFVELVALYLRKMATYYDGSWLPPEGTEKEPCTFFRFGEGYFRIEATTDAEATIPFVAVETDRFLFSATSTPVALGTWEAGRIVAVAVKIGELRSFEVNFEYFF